MTTTTATRTEAMERLLRKLRTMGACGQRVGSGEGMDLVRQHPTPEAWWAASERGDDMLWLAGRAGIRRQDLVLAACACARLALPHVRAGEERPLRAIETAERWARGDAGVTLADVRNAADAAYADAAAAAAAAAYADAAAAAAAAADADAAAAAYAADAAYADADADARTRVLRECAALVRERIPWRVVAEALARRGAPGAKE